MNSPINLFAYAQLATESLSPMAWDYYDSGAGDEITLRDNRDAFDRKSKLQLQTRIRN